MTFEKMRSYITSDSIGIIHFSYLPLRSLWPLWLNHSDATGNDITNLMGRCIYLDPPRIPLNQGVGCE